MSAYSSGNYMQKSFYNTNDWRFSFTERAFTGERVGGSRHLKWSINSILVLSPIFVEKGVILFKRKDDLRNECVKYSFEGEISWRCVLSDSIDVVLIVGNYVLFSMHNRNLAHWQPGSSGSSIEKALATDWVVQSRRIKNGKLLWSQSNLINGIPVEKYDFETYISIRIMNPDAYYRIGELPSYAIEFRCIRNGKLKYGWILPHYYLTKNGFSLEKNHAENIDKSGIGVAIWDRMKPLIKNENSLLQIIFPEINRENFNKSIISVNLKNLNASMKIDGRSLLLKREPD